MYIKCPNCGASHESLTTYRLLQVAFEVHSDGMTGAQITETVDLVTNAKEYSPDYHLYRCDKCGTDFKVKTCDFCAGQGVHSFMIHLPGEKDNLGTWGQRYVCPKCGQNEICRDNQCVEVTVPGEEDRIIQPCKECGELWDADYLKEGLCINCCLKSREIQQGKIEKLK